MRKLLFIVLTSTICSCVTQERCLQKFPPVTKDSVWVKTDTILTHDTIFTPSVDIVFDTTFDFIPKGVVFSHSEKKGGLTSSFSIKNGKIKTVCESDSLKQVISKLEVTIKETELKKSVQMIPCDKEHRDNIDYFYRWFTWIAVVLIVIAVIIKCFRG